VILGAGVMGASIAFQLARRKAGRIVVLDKDHVASGGSSRSSALVRMHYSFAPEVQMALVSLKIFSALGGDCRRGGRISEDRLCANCSSLRN
jgi:glycine/D-amino acid oxidase-like deaminating enzyme